MKKGAHLVRERQIAAGRNRIIKKLRNKKTAIIVAVFLIVFVAALALLLVIRFQSMHNEKPQDKSVPALRVGGTTMSRGDYDVIAKQAVSSKNISNEEVEAEIETTTRLKEASRILNVSVPDGLVNFYANAYTLDSQPTEYSKLKAYIPAFYTVLSLMEYGGSIATIYHAPFQSADQKSYAKNQAENVINVKNLKASTSDGGVISDSIHTYVSLFAHDEKLNTTGLPNYSGVRAVTEDNKIVDIVNTNVFDELLSRKVPLGVSPLPTAINVDVKALQKNQWSEIKEYSNPSSYTVIYKDEAYSKSPGVFDKLQTTLLQIGDGRAQ